jgi:methionyl-tRNA formyltransferase
MKLLYLGYPENQVYSFLREKNNVTQTQEKLSNNFKIEEFDWVISYGYKYILKKEIINRAKNPILNLHISYLPFNRGADPNFWSWIENTPKGVTIHYIDEGIDTGDILIQKEIIFNKEETLTSSYKKLKEEIEILFIENFDNIIKGIILPKKQKEIGTIHFKKDLNHYKHLLTHGWDTPIKYLKK